MHAAQLKAAYSRMVHLLHSICLQPLAHLHELLTVTVCTLKGEWACICACCADSKAAHHFDDLPGQKQSLD